MNIHMDKQRLHIRTINSHYRNYKQHYSLITTLNRNNNTHNSFLN